MAKTTKSSNDIYSTNKPFTYAEYAIKKHFDGCYGFVIHTDRGLIEPDYVSLYAFPEINKSVITSVPMDIVHAGRFSQSREARFNLEMYKLKTGDYEEVKCQE